MPDPDQPNPSTGPTTPRGKEHSSRNAVTHGLCSNILILPDESEEEFNDLKQGWLDDYHPHTQLSRGLVSKAAVAEWYLLRAIRRYNQTEQAICAETCDPMEWTEEHHRKIERFTRYRTTQERSFSRALSNLEQLRKSRQRESKAFERQAERIAELELKAQRQQERMRLEAARLEAQAARETRRAEEKEVKAKAKPPSRRSKRAESRCFRGRIIRKRGGRSRFSISG